MADSINSRDVARLIAFHSHEEAVQHPVSGFHAKGAIRLFPLRVLRILPASSNNGFDSAR